MEARIVIRMFIIYLSSNILIIFITPLAFCKPLDYFDVARHSSIGLSYNMNETILLD